MIRKNINVDYVKNVFNEFNNNWALITAGGKNGFNPMTVSWGTVGILWNKPVVILFVRPTRKTWEYIDKNPKLTLSFFNGKYKENLTLAGRMSGHDYADKYSEIGLTPIYDVDADIYYAHEATDVFKLTKLYVGDINEDSIIDKSIIEANYKDSNYHKVIICKIDQYLVNEE